MTKKKEKPAVPARPRVRMEAMADPALALAMPEAIDISVDIEAQLTAASGPHRPVLFFMLKMRKQAAVAMANLAYVEPTDAEEIRKYQAEVRLFIEFTDTIRQLLAEGADEEFFADQQDREEIAALVGIEPDEQRTN